MFFFSRSSISFSVDLSCVYCWSLLQCFSIKGEEEEEEEEEELGPAA